MGRRWAAVVLGLLPLPLRAVAFDPEAGLPLIRNFPPEVYRGHSQIFATARGADGVMYFGTYGAVVSFDGERWRQFALPGTWTRALATGPDGLVYVGGGSILGRLEPTPDTGELRFASLVDRVPAASRDFASVWSVATAGDEVLFAIDGAVLGWRAGGFHVWNFPGQRPEVRAAGSLVFCHVGERLLQWRDGDWRDFAHDARLGTARRLTVLPADQGVLVALDDGTILHADSDGKVVPWPTPAGAFLQEAGIRNGLRLSDGSYLLSTAGEGILRLAADGTPVRRLTAAEGLANAATYGLGFGSGRQVWIETANGLSVYDPLAPWSFFDPRNGRPDTIGGEPVRFDGTLLLSMSDVPPRRLIPAPNPLGTAVLTPYAPGISGRLSNGVVMHGALFNGSERGVMRMDGEPRLVYPTSSPIEDILPLQALPEVLVVGMLHGVEFVRLSPSGAARRLALVPDFDLETTNIAETVDRTVWIGTTAGVALRLKLDAAGAIVSQTRFDAARGLPAGAGWVRPHARGHDFLVCVKSGVFRLEAAPDRLVPDPRFARWYPTGVNTLPVESDDRGRFWFQVRRADGTFEVGCLDARQPENPGWTPLPASIGAALGFSGARNIVYFPEAGREFLWISGTRSTVRIELDAMGPAPAPPGVVLTELVRGGQRWRPEARPWRLPYSREPLRLLFASPDAVAAAVTYETRLLGYNHDWAAAESPEVSFTNLFGGPFTLEVRARDALGRTGEAARTTFSIAPPWPRTPAAYALYGFAGLGAMLGFVRWRLGRIERERRRLAGLVATRTAELATARDQAEAANRAKSAFLAAMSHELRTPLNGVIGYAQILQADPRLAPDQHERIRVVQQSGEHLLRMINDVLDLAKIEAGKIELRPAPFAPVELLQEVAASHAPAAAGKGLAFATEVDPTVPLAVEGDAQKLRQVLDNLVGNAIKFTAQGRVTLQLRGGAGADGRAALEFRVTDTGAGITAADRDRLFQPFEQAAATRGDAPGTGLGLAISRALVACMGGEIALTSAPGQGSTFAFTVSLPVTAALTVTAGAPAPICGHDGPRRNVLVVDDHAVNRRLLGDLLTPLGFDCTEGASGAEALAHLREAAHSWPDLAVIDVRMSGLDGLALTAAIRALPRGPEVKILLMSASVLTFDPAQGRAAGADDFLAKPFRAPELFEKIGRLLGLQWRTAEVPAAGPHPDGANAGAFPPAVRAVLRDVLEQGDLEAFRAALAVARMQHPEAGGHWDALDAAAAAFQLSRLRQILETS